MKPALERACVALCELAGNPPYATMDGKPLWQSYLPEVRAVLLAVREPSRKMLEAAADIDLGPNVQAGGTEYWHAMIDAAMKEG